MMVVGKLTGGGQARHQGFSVIVTRGSRNYEADTDEVFRRQSSIW